MSFPKKVKALYTNAQTKTFTSGTPQTSVSRLRPPCLACKDETHGIVKYPTFAVEIADEKCCFRSECDHSTCAVKVQHNDISWHLNLEKGGLWVCGFHCETYVQIQQAYTRDFKTHIPTTEIPALQWRHLNHLANKLHLLKILHLLGAL